MMTLRIKYTKENYMKFLGHLELMKLFERVFRRHKFPLKFSEGFNPHPRMTFASPLSVGYSSKYEVMEVILISELPIADVLKTAFPDGIKVLDAAYVDSKTSLMAGIGSSEYLINVSGTNFPNNSNEILEQFLDQAEILYEKPNKKKQMREIDAKPQIHFASMIYFDKQEFTIRCRLQSSSQGNLNPELFAKLFCEYMKTPFIEDEIMVERINMYDHDGKTLFEIN